MKTVLYPAIALMNRLSFGMKFSLISVLFFLPMLVTNFYLVRDSYRQFVGTQTALESLELLGSSLQLRRDLESLNDLVQINAMIGQSGQAGDLEGRIDQLEQSLSAGLQSLQPVTSETEQAAEFVAKRDELLAELKSAEAETSLQSKMVIVEKLLGSSQVFIKLVASQAGLSQDPERQVRQITELITNVTPQITDVLSQGRAVGAYSLGQGFLNSAASTKFDDLLLQLEKLHAEYGLNLQEALAGNVAAQNGLGSLAEASRESLKDSGRARFQSNSARNSISAATSNNTTATSQAKALRTRCNPLPPSKPSRLLVSVRLEKCGGAPCSWQEVEQYGNPRPDACWPGATSTGGKRCT